MHCKKLFSCPKYTLSNFNDWMATIGYQYNSSQALFFALFFLIWILLKFSARFLLHVRFYKNISKRISISLTYFKKCSLRHLALPEKLPCSCVEFEIKGLVSGIYPGGRNLSIFYVYLQSQTKLVWKVVQFNSTLF